VAGLAFSRPVGSTTAAAGFPLEDLLFDPGRFPSEGAWAFCRFTSPEVPAVRMGFQKGGFNIGATAADPDPSLLQLHLEVMKRDGALLWLPTGRFPAQLLQSDSGSLDMRLQQGDRDLARISGWPEMKWSFQSDDAEIGVELTTSIAAVSVLPDCILPHSVFAMWESMGRTRGTVRLGRKTVPVEGAMFYDHPRVLSVSNQVQPRPWYLYTTMAFEDGSGIFGYQSPLAYYCFGFHVDGKGNGRFLPRARLEALETDRDNLPRRWRLSWQDGGMVIDVDIDVRDIGMEKSWGSSRAPRSKKDFIIFPLVLDGEARISEGAGAARVMRGRGLAEYFNADLWKG
jgi:hypothetical protein